MPFKSEKQRKYLWVHAPKVAHAWAHGKHIHTEAKFSKLHHVNVKHLMHPKYKHPKIKV